MALVIDIADAVASDLNAAPVGTFDPGFTAVRRVLPEFELAELAALTVSVVPKAVEINGATRMASQFDCVIDIGVQKKLGKALDAEVAVLCSLVEAIATYLRRRPLAGAPHAVWMRTLNDPIYAPEHLAETRTFTSVLSVTYRSMA
jgi:hypothetical protein